MQRKAILILENKKKFKGYTLGSIDQTIGEGRSNIVDAIKNTEIQLIVNTHLIEQSRYDLSLIHI